jgi:hypothetical protein
VHGFARGIASGHVFFSRRRTVIIPQVSTPVSCPETTIGCGSLQGYGFFVDDELSVSPLQPAATTPNAANNQRAQQSTDANRFTSRPPSEP